MNFNGPLQSEPSCSESFDAHSRICSAPVEPTQQQLRDLSNGDHNINDDDDDDEDSVDLAETSKDNNDGDQQSTTLCEKDDEEEVARVVQDLDRLAITGGTASHPSASGEEDDGGQQRQRQRPLTLKAIADKIVSGRCQNVLLLSGAGVSCSAGIPDFRTPGTGLYDNLQMYHLPYPEAVFDVSFYRQNPKPFVSLARQIWPGMKHSPTLSHSFITLLARHHVLLRNYTQNIDGLEFLAGVPEDKIVECHGHFRTASCIQCGTKFDGKECKRIILEENEAPNCRNKKCRGTGGRVKPDIVFFGESLPIRFSHLLESDLETADLCIVMGTSLNVAPVSFIPNMVSKDCLRVLMNRELVGTLDWDLFAQGNCDKTVRQLCKHLGWEEELDELNLSTRIGGGSS